MSKTGCPVLRRGMSMGLAVLVVAAVASAPAQAAKMRGTLAGSIAGDAMELTGTCSIREKEFEFWSDGTSFAVSNDANGDGMYLNISIMTMGGKTRSALRYNRRGTTVYNGLFEYAELGERSLSVDTTMGRGDVPAVFEVRCGG